MKALNKRLMSINILLTWALALSGITFLTTIASTGKHRLEQARLSGGVSVRASERGNPYINLGDGRNLITGYTGQAEIVEAMEQNQAGPKSLASADFDEDGVADLVCGYAHSSAGAITLHRGNVDSIYPNAPEAQARRAAGEFTDAQFLSPGYVFEVPEAVDFLGAGDFDADGHWDVVAARRGGEKLYLLSGDGQGRFGPAEAIDLSGSLTAITFGEIDRADGLTDIAAAISGPGWNEALIFEGPNGALISAPEGIALPSEATSLALGQLDNSYEMDLAVAVGREMLVVHGRDRSLDEPGQAAATTRAVSRRPFSFAIKSLTTGDFKAGGGAEVAALSDEGALYLLSEKKGEQENSRQKRGRHSEVSVQEWDVEILETGHLPEVTGLVCSRVSSHPNDSLVVIDSANCQLHILTGDAVKGEVSERPRLSASLDVEGEPVAVLPMMLNRDALSDLVVLKSGKGFLSVITTQPLLTFTVTSTADGDDTNIGNGICDGDPIEPGAQCTLRAAIREANANPGADLIEFNIGPMGAHKIDVGGTSGPTAGTALPTITGPVTIDATTQPGFPGTPIIELNGTSAGSSSIGLSLSGGNSTVRGLVINRFNGAGFSGIGISIQTSGGNFIRGNYIGTDINGLSDLGNGGSGVLINGVAGNTVGGTTTLSRNVISGNGTNGITIVFSGATGNFVQGNYIGANAAGTGPIANSGNGVSIIIAANNIIGGVVTRARNIISANALHGVLIGGSMTTSGNIVLGNYIGTNAAGDVDGGNVNYGVNIEGTSGAPGNTIGGSSPTAQNVISGNNAGGIQINGAGAVGNLVQNNLIGTSAGSTSNIGNGGAGVRISGASGNVLSSNTVAFNEIKGVVIASGTGNKITIGNRIFSNNGPGIDLGDDGITPNDGGDADPGANDRQNFPVLNSVSSGQFTTVQGTLNSTPNRTYRLEFFRNSACDSSGNGEGNISIGSISVTTGGGGDVSFTATGLAAVLAGEVVTATATREDTKNTSEFSVCRALTCLSSCTASAPPIVGASLPVSFASSFTSTCGGTTTFDWDFGDGTAHSTLQNPNHSYAVAGVYNWRLTVSNGANTCVQTGTISITSNLPTIASFSPAGGHVGTSVVITGTNYTGATAVRFNGISASFSINSASQITAVVPAGATTGPISIQTPNGTAISSGIFKVGTAIITVNSAADTNSRDGVLTLREAILVANGTISKFLMSAPERAQISGTPTGPSLDEIRFSIGSGAQTINLTSALDPITGPVVINATTQPGFTGQPIIVLNGSSAGAGVTGLRITAGFSTVRGLVINRFSASGISLESNGGNLIAGNFIGTGASGGSDQGNGAHGINILGNDNTIGGTNSAARNVISGNDFRGVSIKGNGNKVQGNFIGVAQNGATALGNGQHGVAFVGNNNTIGARLNLDGTVVGSGNTIAFNKIGVQGFKLLGFNSTGNSILNNLIHSNTVDQIRLTNPCEGLILCSLLSLSNNPQPSGQPSGAQDDSVEPANNNQQAPRLGSVTYNSMNGIMTITGSLRGAPNSHYWLTFFLYGGCPSSVPSGNPQVLNVLPILHETDENGSANINVMIPLGQTPVGFVNAQATDPNNNSSPLSPCVQVNGGCAYSIAPMTQALEAEGGTGALEVVAGDGCQWTAVSNDLWISILSGDAGSGTGRIEYSVLANPGAAPRQGSITVSGQAVPAQTFTVTQNALSCTFIVSPTIVNVGAGGGTGTVNVTAGTGCAWGAISQNPDFITITPFPSASGDGSVSFSVAPNEGAARTGTLIIADQTVTVTQGSGCLYSLDITNQSFAANGGSGSITITAAPDCTWTATSNNTWIIVQSGGNGMGVGTVTYSVVANTIPDNRTGTITVAGRSFTVLQGAAFLDVSLANPFYTEIGKLSARGVTLGCDANNFCPSDVVTRQQMAAFIIRALGDFNPPPPAQQRFLDVSPQNPFYAFIEQMAVRQITLGCGAGNYCPTDAVLRDQMAAFIIRSFGEFNPPVPQFQRFLDVPPTNPFYSFIDRMAVLQITLGCGGNNYCPTLSVKREQMAAFLVRAFNL